jgi:hypothetical protein
MMTKYHINDLPMLIPVVDERLGYTCDVIAESKLAAR